MCGRYFLDFEELMEQMREVIDEINRKYSGKAELAEMKVGEIFPTNIAPVISAGGPELMKWGFPMHGSSRTIINAKSETVFEKPMFKGAVMSRRVVVPTTGFYEWTHEGGKAVDKYLFRVPGEDMMYLAGIYTEFRSAEGAESRYTILTTAANESMKRFHDRMPVYVGHGEREAWIGDGGFTQEVLRRKQPELVAVVVPKKEKEKAAGPVQTSLF